MTDRIHLRGVEAVGYHGVLPDEKRDGQPFVVDVVMELDLAAAGGSDALDDTVSYAEVAGEVMARITGPSFDLIERLAEVIADDVLDHALVDAVTVTVHKPEAPVGHPFSDVAVEVHRTRGVPVVVALGANLGEARASLESAVRAVAALPGMRVRAVSPLVETDPVGGPEQPAYLNAVLVGDSTLSPEDLLRRLHEIEADHGRTREVRWGARTLDLDLIQVGTPGSQFRGPAGVARADASTRASARAGVRPAPMVAGRPGRDAPDRRARAAGRRAGRRGRHDRRAARSGLEPGVVTQPHGIRARVLVAVFVIVAGASWVALKLLSGGGRELPSTSWLAVFIFVALGLGLLVAGRPVKRLVAGRATRPLNPLYAARVLAMAQAAALTGAGIAGWYAAQILLLVPDADIPSQQLQILVLGILTLVAAGLAAIGLVVQRWCRLDEPDPRTGRPGSALRLTSGHDALEHVAQSPQLLGVQHPEPVLQRGVVAERCAAPARVAEPGRREHPAPAVGRVVVDPEHARAVQGVHQLSDVLAGAADGRVDVAHRGAVENRT